MTTGSRQVGTVIIGGGIAGIGIAYYLAEAGETSILVLEGNELASGCTQGSLGGVRQQFSTAPEIELALRGLEFWRNFEKDFDYPCPFYEDGYLLVTGREEVLNNLHAAADVQKRNGAPDVEVLGADQLRDVAPWISPVGLLGGSYTPHDGRFNPTDGLYGIARAARGLGVEIKEHTRVTHIEKHSDGWHVSATENYVAQRVVIAAGLATPHLVRPFGVELDITPLWLHCGYTTEVATGQGMPLTIDLDSGLIIERDGVGACVTVSDPRFGPEGAHRVMEEFATLAAVRAPVFSEVGIRTTTSAAFDATGGDGHAYVGEIEPGLWVLAGFDGHGTMQGPALAKMLSRMMAGLSDPVLDVAMFNPRRIVGGKDEWLRAARN